MKITQSALVFLATAVIGSCSDRRAISDLRMTVETEVFEERSARIDLDSGIETWASGTEYVEAVVFNGDPRLTGQHRVLVEKDGTMHPEIVRSEIVRLDAEQISELEDLITGDFESLPTAGCYLPHHGFIFYDSRSRVVAALEFCLLCGHGGGWSFSGSGQSLDMDGVNKELKPFLASIGLPVFETRAEWEAYFEEAKKAEPGADDQLPARAESKAE